MIINENDINKFIGKFHTSSDINTVFTDEASYWFAYILYRRFIYDGAILVYSDSDHSFGTKIRGRVYGITGDVTEKCIWEPWLEFGNDPDKEQIIQKYIMF